MNIRWGLLGTALVLAGCADVGNDASLSLPDTFRSVYFGDTTDAVKAVKKARDASGRMRTDAEYTDFYLISEDTTVARVFEERRIIGVKAGNTQISARDKNATLSSPQYEFTVGCVAICSSER